MSDSTSYKYNKDDHILVHISNSSVYKTQIIDRRTITNIVENTVYLRKEYQIKNTSQDAPSLCWVNEDKCFSVYDIQQIINLDKGI